MLRIKVSKQVQKTLENIHPKHSRQIARKIVDMQTDPYPNDSKQLKGKYSKYRRADAGEYRIVYFVEQEILYITVVGKRNDDEVYKILNRK